MSQNIEKTNRVALTETDLQGVSGGLDSNTCNVLGAAVGIVVSSQIEVAGPAWGFIAGASVAALCRSL